MPEHPRRRRCGWRITHHGVPLPTHQPLVAPATRIRVLHAAQLLHYVASPAAVGLASGRTTAVAVIVPAVDRWFLLTVLAAVQERLAAAGLDLLL